MANPPFQAAALQHASRQEHLYLLMYMDWSEATARRCQKYLVDPGVANSFGRTSVNDWPIYDGPDTSKARIVARARAHCVQSSVDGGQSFHINNIVFLDNSCYPGSTLVTAGTTTSANGEWAILGGTGEFGLAQGVVFYERNLRGVATLHVGVSYTSMRRSTLRLMFSEFNPSEVDDAEKKGTRLGEGGYGTVYMATIRDTLVAVKIRRAGSSQGKKEFEQEVSILKRIRHPNLVTLVGVCRKKLALFYEYLPNGTLLDRLEKESLSWEERVRIASSICSALEFLHTAEPTPIAHGDLKPGNILFDANNICKLSDFGIARPLKHANDTTTPSHSTAVPMGTDSYMDPEFRRTRKLTPYSDVYALGIILLQLVTGQDPWRLREFVSRELGEIEKLSEDMQTQKICEQLVDPKLKLDDGSKQDATRMIRLGMKCSNDTRKKRPKMATVVRPEIESMRRDETQRREEPSSSRSVQVPSKPQNK